jgi:hypothetical protein
VQGDADIQPHEALYFEVLSQPQKGLHLSYSSFKIHIYEDKYGLYHVNSWCSSVVGKVPSSKRFRRWKLPILTNVRIRNGTVYGNVSLSVDMVWMYWLFVCLVQSPQHIRQHLRPLWSESWEVLFTHAAMPAKVRPASHNRESDHSPSISTSGARYLCLA